MRDCVCTACEEDMLEIARQLERTAVWFRPIVLIGPGLVCVLLGLFLWLGGLGCRRVLTGTIGAVCGGVCGFFMSGRKIEFAMITAALSAVLAVVFERIFTAVLTGVLAAILYFAVWVGLDIDKNDARHYSGYETGDIAMSLNAKQSLGIVKRFIADFAAEIRLEFSRVPVYQWALIEVVAVFFLAVGFTRKRLTSAFCCAVLGTMFIFAGMILLLLYKGAAPVSRICQNVFLYQGIFGAMTAFGMAAQLLLCQRIQGKLMGKKGNSKDMEESKETESWRNR